MIEFLASAAGSGHLFDPNFDIFQLVAMGRVATELCRRLLFMPTPLRRCEYRRAHPLRDPGRGTHLNRSIKTKGGIAMNHQAFWSDRELGHPLTAHEIHCIVCLDETGRQVGLHRWEVVETEEDLAA